MDFFMSIIIDTTILTKIFAGDVTLVNNIWELNDNAQFFFPDPVLSEVRVFCNLTRNISESLKTYDNLIDQAECSLTSGTKHIWEQTSDIFTKYLKNRVIGKIHCPKCGVITTFTCPHYRNNITSRQHILMDVVIGAFAELDRDKSLCTLDSGVYKTYFPEINLV